MKTAKGTIVPLATGHFSSLDDLAEACTTTFRGIPQDEKKEGDILFGFENESHIKAENFSRAHHWDATLGKGFRNFLNRHVSHDAFVPVELLQRQHTGRRAQATVMA